MSLGKRNSSVGGGMLSVPRARAPAPVINIYNSEDGDGKGGGGGGKATAGGGTTIPGAGKGRFYDPKEPVPQISDKDSYPQSLDKLTTGMGQFRDVKGRPGKEVDQKQASAMQSLAKGQGAGKGKQKKANESAIASLLSFGKLRGGKKSGTGKILSGAR